VYAELASLSRQKDAALSIPGAQEWVNGFPNEQNKRFTSDYRKSIPVCRQHSAALRPTTRRC
jgi:hypothetical protein